MSEPEPALDVSDQPASSAADITPSDTNGLEVETRGIYVGGSGDIAVIMVDGQQVTFRQAVAGSLLPIRVWQVLDTGTTASDLLAVW